MIVEVDASNLQSAAEIHSESWKQSHQHFCSKAFVEKHSAQAQAEYLRREMDAGKRLYMLVEETPKGIVSVLGDLIENLYVLPGEQRKGYGTRLLLFAMEKCAGAPRLWILDNNKAAYSLYAKHGFKLTGGKHALSDTLSEVEMRKSHA